MESNSDLVTKHFKCTARVYRGKDKHFDSVLNPEGLFKVYFREPIGRIGCIYFLTRSQVRRVCRRIRHQVEHGVEVKYGYVLRDVLNSMYADEEKILRSSMESTLLGCWRR